LANDGEAGVLAERSLGQGLAGERAFAGDARFGDLQLVTKALDAGDGRTDFVAGADR
jgi:hypothetical protein